jgi:hypothetical protein
MSTFNKLYINDTIDAGTVGSLNIGGSNTTSIELKSNTSITGDLVTTGFINGINIPSILDNWYEESIVQSNEIFTTINTFNITSITVNDIGKYRSNFNAQFSITNGLPYIHRCPGDIINLIIELSGLTYTSHVAAYGNNEVIYAGNYSQVAATTHSGNITLDAEGNPDAVFVFKCGAAHAINTAGSGFTLINGAKLSNVYWLVTGAITTAGNCALIGNYIGSAAVNLASGCTLEGRICTILGAITTTNNVFQLPASEINTTFNLGAFANFVIFDSVGDITDTSSSNIITGEVACGTGSVIGFLSPIINQAYTAPDTNTLNPTVLVSFGIYANDVLIVPSLRCVQSNIYNDYFSINISCNVTTTNIGEMISAQVRVNSTNGSVFIGNRTFFVDKLY